MDFHALARDATLSLPIEKAMARQMLGSLIFAMGFATLLFGALGVQVYLYFVMYKDDRRGQKCLIGVISLLSGLMVIFSAITVFLNAISVIGGVTLVSHIPWSMKAQIFTSLPIISMIHILHLRRIWILRGKDVVLPLIVSIVVAVEIVLRIVNMISILCARVLADLPTMVNPVMLGVFAMTAVADIAITSALCAYFRRSKDNIEYGPTKTTIEWLGRAMLYSGATSCAWSLCAFIIFVASPNTWFYMIPMAWSTVYTNSFLAMLLSRQSLRTAAVV